MILRFFKRRNKDAIVESPPAVDSPTPVPESPVPEPPVKKVPKKRTKKIKE